ncbi:TPA: fimbrial protein [Escherichia coli]|uniref:F107 fimbrial protein n=1 Tax=Escherichia coli TaxID=562 RepID=UPI00050BB319|nr:F107 fimbrial protein [Escherichia coli]ELO4290504.1 fimbrial protein [Escherichia coli]KAB3167677.1 fimbrial protein [Escherichia coli]KAB3181618.1 fimbrial protein [Escherichia coli]KAB3193974.1 fimbrial protein [Escherichia coli]MCV1352506.1 fimbrial protein [Escherichia coli]
MKRLIITSAIVMTIAAGSAMASQGDIQFFGNVTEITCDVTPEVNGSVTDMVQLGTVTKNGKGEEKHIKFKATDSSGGQCSALASKTATFTWAGNLGENGINAQGGLADDAYVIFTPVNANNGNNPITASQQTATFDAEKATSNGFEFKAQLQGKDKVGDFYTAAAYAVTYQ